MTCTNGKTTSLHLITSAPYYALDNSRKLIKALILAGANVDEPDQVNAGRAAEQLAEIKK